MASKPSMSFNLGLPALPEVDSPELYGALLPVYNAIKNSAYALDSYTGNTMIDEADWSEINPFTQLLAQKTAVVFVKLIEDVQAGHTISFVASGGKLAARKALGSTYHPHAFAVSAGATGQFIPACMFGLCQLIGGLTPGTEYYQSATAGAITSTVVNRKIGVALGPNHLWFNPT